MSRKSRDRKRSASILNHTSVPTKTKDARKGGLVLLAIMICIALMVGALANWRSLTSFSTSSGTAAPYPTPQPMPANAPSKEYVYAGSSLVSTVEPFRVPPTDLAVWRPSNGTWYVLNSAQQEVTQQWGQDGDIPAPGDYDGDGKTDFCVYRPSTNTWYIIPSTTGNYYTYQYGLSGDLLAPADFDGDGKTNPALFRPSDGNWYVIGANGYGAIAGNLGTSGDVPVPADYDGDGRSDLAVWRDSNATFYVLKSGDGQTTTYSLGQTGDKPMTGDYDGDGKSDYAVRRGNIYFIRQSSDATVYNYTFSTGLAAAVHGRYNDAQDTDAKTDIATYQASRTGASTWTIRRSSDGTTRTVQFGQSGDIPVPAAWKR